MWAYAIVVGPVITFVGTGVLLVAQATNQPQRFAGWVLIGLGALTLLLSYLRYAIEKDDREHAFYRVLPTGEVRALFTYPEYRHFPHLVRTELLHDPLVDQWVQDEIDRRALRHVRSPRLTSVRDTLRVFFE